MLHPHETASRTDRRRDHPVGANLFDAPRRQHHVDDRVGQTDLMERHFVDRHAVCGGLGFGRSARKLSSCSHCRSLPLGLFSGTASLFRDPRFLQN